MEREGKGRGWGILGLSPLVVAVVLMTLLRPRLLDASDLPPEDAPDARPKVALVLSGGGARGFAHIGILRAFEEAGIPFDVIVGTSMGAIVGSLFACGYTPAEIESLVLAVDWVKLLRPKTPRKPLRSVRYGEAHGILTLRFRGLEPNVAPGLLPAQRIYELLLELTGEMDVRIGGRFDRLMVPIRVVSADLKRGQLVVFDHGHIAKCVLAAMAIPFFFAPVPWGDSLLVDGGLLDNTPVDVARASGADIVLAVDVSSIGEREVRYDDMIDIYRRTMDIWMTRTNLLYREKPDLLLRPYLEERSPLDYFAADTLIALGYRYALSTLDSIRQLVPWRRDWGSIRDGFLRRVGAEEPPPFSEPVIEGLRSTRSRGLIRNLSVREGEPFNVHRVVSDVRSLYETGLFDAVLANLQLEENRWGRRVHVTYEAVERDPFVLSLGGSFVRREGEAGFLQLRHLNILGSGARGLLSWRFGPQRTFLAAEWSLTNASGSPFGLQAAAFWERNRPWWYSGAKPMGRREFDLVGGEIGVVRSVGRESALMFTLLAENGVRHANGSLGLTRFEWRARGYGLSLAGSTLDDPFVPGKGALVRLSLRHFLARLGGTISGAKTEGQIRGYIPAGRVTLGLMAQFGLQPNRWPEELWYKLGGPDAFQGLELGEAWRPGYLACNAELRYRYSSVLHLSSALSLGWMSEAWNLVLRAQPFCGWRIGLRLVTPVGPAAFDLAYGESGRWTYYVSVGYPF